MKSTLTAVLRFTHGSTLLRNISLTLGRQMVAAAAQLLTVVLIARNLGPLGNGLYTMAILLPSMLVQLFNFGIGPATVYYVGRRTVSARQAIRENLRLAVAIAAIGILITLPVLLLLGERIFPGVPPILLFLGLLSFPISLLQSFWITVLQGAEDFRAFNRAVVVPPVVMLLGTGLSLLVFADSIEAVLVAYLAGQVAGLWQVWRDVRHYRQKSDVIQHTVADLDQYKRKLLSYGWKAHLSNIMTFVNYRADIFMINLFLDPISTGLYTIAVQMAERLWMLSQAASTVLLPRLSAMQANPTERYKLTIKASIAVGAITLSGAGALTVALYYLLEPVFGTAYTASFEPFLWFLPGIVAGAVARIHSNSIAASGRPEWNLYTSILIAGLNISSNWLLIPTHGIVGAAIATTSVYVINAIINLFLVKKTARLYSYF